MTKTTIALVSGQTIRGRSPSADQVIPGWTVVQVTDDPEWKPGRYSFPDHAVAHIWEEDLS